MIIIIIIITLMAFSIMALTDAICEFKKFLKIHKTKKRLLVEGFNEIYHWPVMANGPSRNWEDQPD